MGCSNIITSLNCYDLIIFLDKISETLIRFKKSLPFLVHFYSHAMIFYVMCYFYFYSSLSYFALIGACSLKHGIKRHDFCFWQILPRKVGQGEFYPLSSLATRLSTPLFIFFVPCSMSKFTRSHYKSFSVKKMP